MPRKETTTAPITAESQQSAVSDGIDAFELPKALVTKIAKSALPENAQLRKESVLALLKGSTVFINLLGAAAHDVATSKQHKSVSASDVLRALEYIQFTDIIELLQSDLQTYRELQKSSRKSAAAGTKGKASEVAAVAQAPESMGPPQYIPPSKSKGKERAVGGLQLSDHEIESRSELGGLVDVDTEMIDGDQLEGKVVDEIDPSEDPPEDDEDDADEEDRADQIAIEEDQLNKDAVGLDYPEPEPEE